MRVLALYGTALLIYQPARWIMTLSGCVWVVFLTWYISRPFMRRSQLLNSLGFFRMKYSVYMASLIIVSDRDPRLTAAFWTD
jgi:hypothetical protein